MDSVAFEVENLNLMFNDFHALKDVNIKIPKNKIVSIIGPSGAANQHFFGVSTE